MYRELMARSRVFEGYRSTMGRGTIGWGEWKIYHGKAANVQYGKND